MTFQDLASIVMSQNNKDSLPGAVLDEEAGLEAAAPAKETTY